MPQMHGLPKADEQKDTSRDCDKGDNNNNRYLYTCSAFSKAQSALQHFVGDLARLLFTGANISTQFTIFL